MRIRIISKDGLGTGTRIELEDGTPFADQVKSVRLWAAADSMWTADLEMLRPMIDVVASVRRIWSPLRKPGHSIKARLRRMRARRYRYMQITH